MAPLKSDIHIVISVNIKRKLFKQTCTYIAGVSNHQQYRFIDCTFWRFGRKDDIPSARNPFDVGKPRSVQSSTKKAQHGSNKRAIFAVGYTITTNASLDMADTIHLYGTLFGRVDPNTQTLARIRLLSTNQKRDCVTITLFCLALLETDGLACERALSPGVKLTTQPSFWR